MNKREKELLQLQLEAEEDVIHELEKQYNQALKDINQKVKLFEADIQMLDEAINTDGMDEAAKAMLQSQKRSKVYQKQFQEALQGQISGILDRMQGNNYSTIESYLKGCYEDAFIGTMYNIHGQGVPIIMPIDQAAAVKAIMTDSKISKGLYNSLGVDVSGLKKAIRQEITRGIGSGLLYSDIARNIANTAKAPLSRAKTIVRTEGHRIQQQSADDARRGAISRGCDVVKQWDSTLDGKTRPNHRMLDGQIREEDEPFEVAGMKAMFPGEFGDPAEDCNCRCVALTRARWALDEDELKTLQDRAEYFGLDKTKDIEDFKNNYLQSSMMVHAYGDDGDLAVPYSERGISIEPRLQEYLRDLKANSDYITRPSGEIKVQDLAILTTETGVEYTTITINNTSYLIRGAAKHTTIPQSLIDELIQNHGTLDYHSHPFIGDLRPSPEDQELLRQLTWQETSVIIEPTQNTITFTKYGAVGTVETANYRSEEYYASLIWGDDDVE